MIAYEIGDGTALRRVERPDPVPGPGQAVMRVRATGLNARDLSIMQGQQFSRRIRPDLVPLMDNAGDIIAVGPGVEQVAIGDRVTMTHYWRWLDGAWHGAMAEDDYGCTIDGFLAEQVLVPAAALIKLPESLGYEAASTLQSAGLTGWHAVVEAGRVRAGDTVLTLGTGGVSVFALQWAKLHGARVIVTSSSDAKLETMRALGADHGINYRRDPDWPAQLRAVTGGEGADIVVNTVGIGALVDCLEATASNGRVLYVGANPVDHSGQSGPVTGIERLPNLIMKNITLQGVIVGSRRMLVDLIAAMTQNGIEPVIDQVYDWNDVDAAIARMKSPDRLGKVVIRIPS